MRFLENKTPHIWLHNYQFKYNIYRGVLFFFLKKKKNYRSQPKGPISLGPAHASAKLTLGQTQAPSPTRSLSIFFLFLCTQSYNVRYISRLFFFLPVPNKTANQPTSSTANGACLLLHTIKIFFSLHEIAVLTAPPFQPPQPPL